MRFTYCGGCRKQIINGVCGCNSSQVTPCCPDCEAALSERDAANADAGRYRSGWADSVIMWTDACTQRDDAQRQLADLRARIEAEAYAWRQQAAILSDKGNPMALGLEQAAQRLIALLGDVRK